MRGFIFVIICGIRWDLVRLLIVMFGKLRLDDKFGIGGYVVDVIVNIDVELSNFLV